MVWLADIITQGLAFSLIKHENRFPHNVDLIYCLGLERTNRQRDGGETSR